jgi:CRISPR-associated endonuclease/helicase Cas3
MQTPDYLQDILAKSDGETLFAHTWNVVTRFADQARLRRDIPTWVRSPRLWHRLYWACLLHDFGKVAGGFQAVLRPNGPKRWGYRHEVGSLAFVPWLFPDPKSDDYRWVVAAIVSHHKDAAWINRDYKDGGPAIRDIAAELARAPVDRLWRWVSEYGQMWQQELALNNLGIEVPALMQEAQAVAIVREQGIASIEQALRVYRRFIDELTANPILRKQATVTLALRGIIITADHSASAHTGPPPKLPMMNYQGLVQRLDWSEDQLYTHQSASAYALGSAALNAPTGSGKTESAFFWAFGSTPQPVPRIFYALPFQASMNAMQRRLERYFPGMVGLQHGRTLQALYRVYVEDGDDPHFAMQRAKERKNRTELNYFPIRVFSPYQMLKACYKLRGYESILSDYFGAAFIFDEIHAYEPKRLALICTLVAYLRQQYQARFFVMSATFPDLIKRALSQALGDYTEITADDNLFAAFQRHTLHLLDGDMQEPHNLARILADAQSKKSVLVCCNTVQRAQEMWEAVRSGLGADATIVLLHSRLNGRDRLQREQQVMNACGLDSQSRQPVVVIATQVVEVSLNIDLDTIYTDPAPLEALIQRFGRVNRGRKKDAEGRPILADVHVFREPIPEKDLRPYDLRLLRGTLRLLEEQREQPIDEHAVSNWLNTIYEEYAEDYAQSWQEIYDKTAADFEQGVIRSLVAFNTDDGLEMLFYKAFDSIEVLPQRFEREYFDLMRDGLFVEAASLMVSIAYWQYNMLAKEGKVRQGDRTSDDVLERLHVVRTTYDDDMGLLFDV